VNLIQQTSVALRRRGSVEWTVASNKKTSTHNTANNECT